MKAKMKIMKVLKWVLLGLGGLVFFWFLPLKLLVKLRAGRGAPCPSSLAGLIDHPVRRWDMRHTLERIKAQPGETVLELGPGPGTFTVDVARRVGPAGKVIAVDLQPEMIAMLEERVRAAGVTHVETHVANAYELPVETGSVDRAFLVTVLAEIPDPVRALCEVRRVLKPGGVLSVTEEFLDPDYPRRATVIRWAEAAGFTLEERLGTFWVYTLNFV